MLDKGSEIQKARVSTETYPFIVAYITTHLNTLKLLGTDSGDRHSEDWMDQNYGTPTVENEKVLHADGHEPDDKDICGTAQPITDVQDASKEDSSSRDSDDLAEEYHPLDPAFHVTGALLKLIHERYLRVQKIMRPDDRRLANLETNLHIWMLKIAGIIHSDRS